MRRRSARWRQHAAGSAASYSPRTSCTVRRRETEVARLCLRGGFQAFNRIARAMGIQVTDEHDPQAGISLSYQEFLDGVARMREVGFQIKREPAEAWPDFAGWRINYEQAAYAVAAAV